MEFKLIGSMNGEFRKLPTQHNTQAYEKRKRREKQERQTRVSNPIKGSCKHLSSHFSFIKPLIRPH
jgi:hypothetical protein